MSTSAEVEIEIIAANLAVLVEEHGLRVLDAEARRGWRWHEDDKAEPVWFDTSGVQVGWLARQIWCHDKAAGIEHVCRCSGGFTCIGCLDEARAPDSWVEDLEET